MVVPQDVQLHYKFHSPRLHYSPRFRRRRSGLWIGIASLHRNPRANVDIFIGVGDVLLSFVDISTFTTEFKVSMDTNDSRISAKPRHSFNFGMGIECL